MFGHRIAVIGVPAVMIGLSLLVLSARAEGLVRGFSIREAERWPYPTLAPNPTTSPGPRGGGSTLSAYSSAYERVMLDEARARVPFQVLVPSQLPAGYGLAAVFIPPGGTMAVSPDLRERSSYVQLVYSDPAKQRPALHTTNAPNELPDLALTIMQAPVDRSPDATLYIKPSTSEALSIDGLPAIYLKALSVRRPGTEAVFADDTRSSLLFERAGVRVTLTGHRAGGVDREALVRTAASLR